MSRVVYINLVGEPYSLTLANWRMVVEAATTGKEYAPLVIALGRRLARFPNPWLNAIYDLEEWDEIDWQSELDKDAVL